MYGNDLPHGYIHLADRLLLGRAGRSEAEQHDDRKVDADWQHVDDQFVVRNVVAATQTSQIDVINCFRIIATPTGTGIAKNVERNIIAWILVYMYSFFSSSSL